MNKNLSMISILTACLMLVACAKNEDQAVTASEASAVLVEQEVSAEQQAAIDSIDAPILDEKNTDVPAEIANAPSDEATLDASLAASSVTSN